MEAAELEAMMDAAEADVVDAEVVEEQQSIEDIAANGGAEEEERETYIEGARQLSLLAGGEEPTSSSMRLRGGSVPVEGEFEKGDRMRLVVEVVVSEVHFVDVRDPAGFVARTERRHVAKAESVSRM